MRTRELGELLAGQELLAGLPDDDLDLLVGCARLVRFRPGQVLFREGSPADACFVIRTGRVAIEVHDPGDGARQVGTVGPGQMVGWSWLYEPYRWRFDARALDTVRAIELDGACIRAKCDEDPAFGYRVVLRFLRSVGDRLLGTRLQLLDLYGPRGTAAGPDADRAPSPGADGD